MILDAFNLGVTRLFDILLYPFRGLHPMWGLVAISVLTGVAAMWVFRRCTNRAKLAARRSAVQACLLEMWIFRDNTRVVLRAQARTLWNTLMYAAVSLPGLAVVMLPVIVVMVQLQARYGYEPLRTGDSAIVKVRYADATRLEDLDVKLDAARGLAVETPPLRIPADGEVDFRIKGLTPGEHGVTATLEGQCVLKSVRVGEAGLSALSPVRSSGWLDRFLHPAERILPRGKIISIEVRYGPKSIPWWGMDFGWIWVFLVVSLAAGFVLGHFLGSES